MIAHSWFLADPAATDRWAEGLAAVLPSNFFYIALQGGLGAGKTHTVRALLRALGEQGAVRSPTYTLLEDYALPGHRVVHMDLYRLGDAQELEYLGIRDLLAEPLTLITEWPQRGEGALPPADLHIAMSIEPEGGRSATVTAYSALAVDVLEKWRANSSF